MIQDGLTTHEPSQQVRGRATSWLQPGHPISRVGIQVLLARNDAPRSTAIEDNRGQCPVTDQGSRCRALFPFLGVPLSSQANVTRALGLRKIRIISATHHRHNIRSIAPRAFAVFGFVRSRTHRSFRNLRITSITSSCHTFADRADAQHHDLLRRSCSWRRCSPRGSSRSLI